LPPTPDTADAADYPVKKLIDTNPRTKEDLQTLTNPVPNETWMTNR
jgi:hypothetical protein